MPATFVQVHHAIEYAFMPNKPAATDPLMARLPAALRERMHANGHTQIDVEKLTGVPQPQISKALKGVRKRSTEPMRRLCRYAAIGAKDDAPHTAELVELLQQVVASGPATAECVRGILQNLAALSAARTDKPGRR